MRVNENKEEWHQGPRKGLGGL
ncbi:unnamed protein product [Lathyrus sativus]|nr:unnamed protein product [Lathyrus sativus]